MNTSDHRFLGRRARSVSGNLLFAGLACLLAVPAGASRVLYIAEQDIAYVSELFLADLSRPGESIKLNKPLNVFSNGVGDFAISPDETWIAFSADQDVTGDLDLYLVDVRNPGDWIRIGDLPPGNLELRVRFSPDGNRLAFTASDDGFGSVQLYVVELARPGTVTRMNGQLATNGSVSMTGFDFTPDGRHLVYVAGELDDKYELYSVPLDSPGESVRLNASGGSVGDSYEGRFKILPDAHRVVYSAVWQTAGQRELHMVSIDAPGEPITLNAGFSSGGGVFDFSVSPDGNHVAYVADAETKGSYEVYLASTTATGNVRKISEPVQYGAGLAAFTGDGAFVVFAADSRRGPDERDLYIIPTDGSTPAIQFSAPLPEGNSAGNFALSPDGRQVAYSVVSESGFAEELYLARTDTPGSAVKLNGPLQGGALELFPRPQFSPDGEQVAFIAVESVDTSIQQLYFASVSAPGSSTRVNPPLVAEGILSPRPHAFEFLPSGAPPTGEPPTGSPPQQGRRQESSGGGAIGWFGLFALLTVAVRRIDSQRGP